MPRSKNFLAMLATVWKQNVLLFVTGFGRSSIWFSIEILSVFWVYWVLWMFRLWVVAREFVVLWLNKWSSCTDIFLSFLSSGEFWKFNFLVIEKFYLFGWLMIDKRKTFHYFLGNIKTQRGFCQNMAVNIFITGDFILKITKFIIWLSLNSINLH